MTDEKAQDKLADLNNLLMGVENRLLHRAIDRDRGELDHASDFINDMADKGIIDITCTNCDDAGGEAPEVSDAPGVELPAEE